MTCLFKKQGWSENNLIWNPFDNQHIKFTHKNYNTCDKSKGNITLKSWYLYGVPKMYLRIIKKL